MHAMHVLACCQQCMFGIWLADHQGTVRCQLVAHIVKLRVLSNTEWCGCVCAAWQHSNAVLHAD